MDGNAFSSTKYRDLLQSALDRGRQQFEAVGLGAENFDILVPTLVRAAAPTFAEDPNERQVTALLLSLLQYPVHMYSVFMLRARNESHLVEGSTEQDWGFGQVVAVILLGNNVVMLVEGFSSTCLLLSL